MTKRKARSQDMQGRKVVDAFVSFLGSHGHPGLKVCRWPEDYNRVTPAIDAIAAKHGVDQADALRRRDSR
jgi:hypothetical protein